MGHEELQPEDIDVTTSALRGALRRTWCAFCATSSIHGLKYTKDKETNRYIRFIWILIILLMFLCAVAMAITFYMEYRSNPTRMNVENEHAPTSSLLFPPVIVCPEQIYNLQQTLNFLKTLKMPNATSIFEISSLLYYARSFTHSVVDLEPRSIYLLEEVLTLNKLNIVEFTDKLSWNCADLLFKCRFKDEIVPCDILFQATYTFRGRCCGLNLNNISNSYALAGLRNGLSLILRYNGSLKSEEATYARGFQIIMQERGSFTSPYSIIRFLALNREMFMTIRPTQTFCSQSVADLPFEDRLCIFPHEKKLKFFDLNLGANCKLNCRIENMLNLCNCYPHFHHKIRSDERMCSYRDLPCMTKNFATIIGRFRSTQCTCYRNCEQIEYDAQSSNTKLSLDIPTIDPFYDGIEKDYCVAHIYFNSQVYRRIRHDLLTNMVALVSNLGSAFSLFVGMSMISAVEIVYYFSIILNKFYQQECRARILLSQQNQQRQTLDIAYNQLRKNKAGEGKNMENNLMVEEIHN